MHSIAHQDRRRSHYAAANPGRRRTPIHCSSTSTATDTPWRAHLFERLRQQIQATADPALIALQAELQQYPVPEDPSPLVLAGEMLGVVMPFCFESVHGMLSLISTTTIFGTPVDVTLQELAVESFFPADDFTEKVLHDVAQRHSEG